jgi:thiamine phosphate synthase YjbQ (UPF0047 family)
MRMAQGLISVATRGQGLYEVTAELSQWLAKQGVQAGLLTLFVRHTSASLLVQENAAPEGIAGMHLDFPGYGFVTPREGRYFIGPE